MSPAALRATTGSAEATRDLAARLAELVRAGDVVVLAGEMGAGKTAFAQGFAKGLGVAEHVTSPTFTIVREYGGGRLALHHLDVYRLEQLREVSELGVAEMLDEQAVMLVEWGDAVLPVLGDQYLEIRITFGGADDERRFEVLCRGGRWRARRAVVADVLAPWAVGGVAGSGETGEGEPC